MTLSLAFLVLLGGVLTVLSPCVLPVLPFVFARAGLQAPADEASLHSPETYLGYARAERFGAAAGLTQGQPATYAYPTVLASNQWALQGRWLVDRQDAALQGDDGYGVVREQRLYQLVRQSGAARERTFTIWFLDAGVRAYAFTFG